MRQTQPADWREYQKFGISSQDSLELLDGEAFVFAPGKPGTKHRLRESTAPHGGITPGMQALRGEGRPQSRATRSRRATTHEHASADAQATLLPTLNLDTITTWWTSHQIDEPTFLALLKAARMQTPVGGIGNTRETAPGTLPPGEHERAFPVSAPKTAPVFGAENRGNGEAEPLETPSEASPDRVITGVFPASAGTGETAMPRPTLETLGVTMETIKHIKKMKEAGFPDRDISKIVDLAGRKYDTYRKVLESLGYGKDEAQTR
jgi:hypothetical protein